jgi:hypothetical protein
MESPLADRFRTGGPLGTREEEAMDTVRLVTIGGGIRAVFYKGGTRIGECDLGRKVSVRRPNAEELADRPPEAPDFAEQSGRSSWLSFSGFYVVPDLGLAAIFGAIPDAVPAS